MIEFICSVACFFPIKSNNNRKRFSNSQSQELNATDSVDNYYDWTPENGYDVDAIKHNWNGPPRPAAGTSSLLLSQMIMEIR